MTDDEIPDEDYESAVSKAVSRYTSENSFWDVAEIGTILGIAFLGVQILLGNFGFLPLFAGLLGVWYTFAKVADTRVDQRIDVTDTGWARETKQEDTRRVGSDDCAATDEAGVSCCSSGKVVRSYDVLRVGGYELTRRLSAENTYCSDHFALEYPSESDRDIGDIVTDGEAEAEEEMEKEVGMSFR